MLVVAHCGNHHYRKDLQWSSEVNSLKIEWQLQNLPNPIAAQHSNVIVIIVQF